MEIKRKTIIFVVFDILLSLAGLFTILLFKPSLTKDTVKGLSITIFSIQNLFIFVVLFIFILIFLRHIDKLLHEMKVYETNEIYNSKIFYWKTFVITCASWGIWFWLYYPGAGMNDTIADITTFHNGIQPLVYQLIIYYGVNGLTNFTHSMTVAYAILVVTQMGIMSLIISWIANWLKRKGLSHILINLFVA